IVYFPIFPYNPSTSWRILVNVRHFVTSFYSKRKSPQTGAFIVFNRLSVLLKNALRLRIFCAILCLCLLKLPPGYRLHAEVQVTDPCHQSHELARGLLHLVCSRLAALQVPAFHLATVFPRLNKLNLTRQLHRITPPEKISYTH